MNGGLVSGSLAIPGDLDGVVGGGLGFVEGLLVDGDQVNIEVGLID